MSDLAEDWVFERTAPRMRRTTDPPQRVPHVPGTITEELEQAVAFHKRLDDINGTRDRSCWPEWIREWAERRGL